MMRSNYPMPDDMPRVFRETMEFAIARSTDSILVTACSAYVGSGTRPDAGRQTSSLFGNIIRVSPDDGCSDNGPSKRRVIIGDGTFEALDLGSTLTLESRDFNDLCVVKTLSCVDLVDGKNEITWDIVEARSTSAMRAFNAQAIEAEE